MSLMVRSLRPKRMLQGKDWNTRKNFLPEDRNQDLHDLANYVWNKESLGNLETAKIGILCRDSRMEKSFVVARWEDPRSQNYPFVGYTFAGISEDRANEGIQIFSMGVHVPRWLNYKTKDIVQGLVLATEEIWRREFFNYRGQTGKKLGYFPGTSIIPHSRVNGKVKKWLSDVGYDKSDLTFVIKNLHGNF